MAGSQSNNDAFVRYRVKFGNGKGQLSIGDWREGVDRLYSFYTNRKTNLSDPYWDRCYDKGLDPSEAVHELIDPPEFEVEDDLLAGDDAEAVRDAVAFVQAQGY